MEELNRKLRAIPGIDSLMAAAAGREELSYTPHNVLVAILRQATEVLRKKLRDGQVNEVSPDEILIVAENLLQRILRPSLRRVVNATGVVLHTNLGRAPLSKRAQERVCEIMQGYSTLEYDVENGERGSRYSHVAQRICELTGAEDAIVVNNNAAAVLLVLLALCKDREVIVSRGELVEIGGSFRIPDVMRQSGAVLVEVGTTNKTHIYDYEQAINEKTAAILKVHTSNYRIIGFTHQPLYSELTELASKRGIPLIEDLGSGTLLSLSAGDSQEPTVGERIAAGVDIVTFSGDKLFGGAQAGIIAGRRTYLDKMRKHPLLRAIRIDKLTLAAIEGTLIDYSLGRAVNDIPVQKMLHISVDELYEQAESLAAALKKVVDRAEIAVIKTRAQSGGGALPAEEFDSYGVSLKMPKISSASVERNLRQRDIPIVARIQDDRVIFDVRCLMADDMPEIAAALAECGKGAKR